MIPFPSTSHRLQTAPGRFGQMSAVAFTITLLVGGWISEVPAQSPYASATDFEQHARMLRENALMKVEPQVFVPSSNSPAFTPSRGIFSSRYPWKENIVTTVFWIGELPTKNNPTPNHASSWDPNWAANYGGYDDPDPAHRRGFLPAAFVPRQNPFYCALPYNDVTRGSTKPEAKVIIPWFRQAFEQEGHTVCKGRWIAIRHGNRMVYAQWEDCGPFSTEAYQYVFGTALPRPNLNGGAGLDVSPAVRDALGMNSTRDVCSWKFVEINEVPPGPWRQYGENNVFANRALGNPNAARVQGNAPVNSLFGR